MYTNLSPRPATLDDLPQVLKINQTVDPPWSETSFRQEIDKKHSGFWVITDDETDSHVLAYAVFSYPAEQAHLQTFAVHPEFRRRRLALGLLRKMIQFLGKKAVTSMVLEVKRTNIPAVKLYQSMGFIIIHTMPRFYADGEAAYSMIYHFDSETTSSEIVDAEFEDVESTDVPDKTRNKKNLI